MALLFGRGSRGALLLRALRINIHEKFRGSLHDVICVFDHVVSAAREAPSIPLVKINVHLMRDFVANLEDVVDGRDIIGQLIGLYREMGGGAKKLVLRL